VAAEDAAGFAESFARSCLLTQSSDERRVELRSGRHVGRGHLVSVGGGVEHHH
ncbi:unnamed protein product, partial [Ectocarpus sp. 12 AP-2014]